MIQSAETRLDGSTHGSEFALSSKPQPDGTLVKALVRAWRWQRMLDDGVYATVSEIGDAENISKTYMSRILRLALLAPDVVEEILAGTADHALVLGKLERPLPPGWEEQRRLLGHAPPEPTFARARDICMPISGADTAKHAVQRSTPSHSGQMIRATPPSTPEG